MSSAATAESFVPTRRVKNAAVASQVRIDESSEMKRFLRITNVFRHCLPEAASKLAISGQRMQSPVEPQILFPEFRTRFHRKT